jgi:hypothetical protein
MGTQIAFGNVTAVVDVASVRTSAPVYTTANVVSLQKLTANAFANSQVRSLSNWGGQTDQTNLLIGTGQFGANLTANTAKLITYFTSGVVGNVRANTGLGTLTTSMSAPDLAANLLIGTGQFGANLTANTAKLITYFTSGVVGNVRANTGLGTFANIILTTGSSTFVSNLYVGLGQYYLANAISLVSHTGGLSSQVSSGGSGQTGKVESWT